MCIQGILGAADNAPMFGWIVSHPLVYPALEVLHIVGIALLVGSLALFELRVWGFGAVLPVPALARMALRLALTGFALIGGSGLLMFAGQPDELLANRAFVLKMGLILVAGLNAAAFHARAGLQRMDRTARMQTVASMGLWLAVIICGRWIAYQ
jgi:hypothetical protein